MLGNDQKSPKSNIWLLQKSCNTTDVELNERWHLHYVYLGLSEKSLIFIVTIRPPFRGTDPCSRRLSHGVNNSLKFPPFSNRNTEKIRDFCDVINHFDVIVVHKLYIIYYGHFT